MLLLFPPPSPPLPSFSTLLVTGLHHPSALLHLAISHVLESPRHEVLVLSPSQAFLRKKLVTGFDEWLSHSGNTNLVKHAMSRILLLYPSTPAHFSLLVATLDGTQSRSDLTYLWGELPVLPTENLSLIILDELSLYFPRTDVIPSQVSSFMSLMQCLIQSTNRISAIRNDSSRISVVCFEASLLGPQREHHHPGNAIRNLFERVIHFDKIEDVSSQTEDTTRKESRTRKCVQFSRSGGIEEEDICIEYIEVVTTCAGNCVSQFLWQCNE